MKPFDPESKNKFKGLNRQKLTHDEYMKGISSGNRFILSKAITLIESQLADDQKLSREIIESCLPLSGNSIRIGITGIPGVGKSTFIESFGQHLINKGRKLAILAVDPTSSVTHGSILADKTRMEELSKSPNAFIRPSPSGTNLGGVSKRTREAVYLCEAAGYDTVIIETVGVGQSGTAVKSMVDFFLLLLLAGAGDEIQGIKRGIMEMADAVLINKSDENNQEAAMLAVAQYKAAIHLFPPNPYGWRANVLPCSAITRFNIDKVWEMILGYMDSMKSNNAIEAIRKDQNRYWLDERIDQLLKERFKGNEKVQQAYHNLEIQVMEGSMGSFEAADLLMEIFEMEINKGKG